MGGVSAIVARSVESVLSLTYVQAVGRARDNARVAVAEEDGKIKAFIPYQLGEQKIAMPIEGRWGGLDGLISSNMPLDVRSVVRQAGLRGWRFFHAPAEQEALAPHRYRHNYHGTTVPIIDLSDGYDAYLSGMNESVRKRVSRTATYRRALGARWAR